MTSKIILHKDFEAPSLRAGLEALLLLANALREVLAKQNAAGLLEGRDQSWIHAIEWLGILSAKEVPHFKQVTEIEHLWTSFLAKADIRNLPVASRALLEQARDQSVRGAHAGESCISDFDRANKHAYRMVETLLAPHGVKHLMPNDRVFIDVYHDSKGDDYCASASRITETIRWAYQPRLAHVLYGLIIIDYLFAHEYLSHLVPRNRYLDTKIRERWLVAALKRSIVDHPEAPRWKKMLWVAYRDTLIRHVQREEVRREPETVATSSFGTSVVEDSANDLYFRNCSLFWAVTVEILALGDDKGAAQLAAEVLDGLDQIVPKLSPPKLYSLNGLYKLLIDG